MDENVVANEVVTETPAVNSTPQQTSTPAPTDSGNVVKETQPVPEDRLDRNPRFREVIAQKNEYMSKAKQMEAELAEYRRRFASPEPKEADPFSDLAPDEREQTEKFISKYVSPKIKSELLKELAPVIQEVQQGKINKQIDEAKTFAKGFGIDFDERLPEVIDFLSRPENKGRLTAKEAMISLFSDEMLENTRIRAKEELSKENAELIEKKKLANTTVTTVAPNSVIQSDEAALRNMSHNERIEYNIKKAIELGKQGVKNPKVRE